MVELETGQTITCAWVDHDLCIFCVTVDRRLLGGGDRESAAAPLVELFDEGQLDQMIAANRRGGVN